MKRVVIRDVSNYRGDGEAMSNKNGSETYMWYVIQTVNGEEHQVCAWINQRISKDLFERCFVPLYEDVWRKEGIGHINIKKMFGGYVFLKTDYPREINEELRKIPNLAILLSDQRGMKENEEKVYLPIHRTEEQFSSSIFTDGLMRVSYIERNEDGKISSVIGPLAAYQEYIIKVDLPHRRAIAEIPFLGETRRIKFGLWSDRDPKIPWIEEEKRLHKNQLEESCHVKGRSTANQAAFCVGEIVINIMGICGDQHLQITDIDERKRTVTVDMPLFGEMISVQMSMDDVEKVGERG